MSATPLGRAPLPRTVAGRLADAVRRTDRLPVLDRALARVVDLADREETSTGELVAAIEGDPGLAASVLRYANSAAHARLMPSRTVRQAVTMVGRRGVRRLALESVTYRFLERAAGAGPASLGRLHVHSLQVAMLAAECARRAGLDTDRAHLAGLLHDCGRLVLPKAFPVPELEYLATRHADGGARARAERTALGADHAHAGALLAEASGVDPCVAAAIALHHGDDDGRLAGDDLTACVVVADVVASLVTTGAGDELLLDAALAALGLDLDVADRLALLLVAEPKLVEPLGPVTDELTGVSARRAWIRDARARLAGGEAGSVVLCDVDGLGAVNARHGRNAGDRVLAEVGELLRRHGCAGRLDADDFVVWVPGGREQAAEAASRIVAEVGAAFGDGLRLTASAGVASATGRLEAVLDDARRALATARAAGGGGIAHASAG